MKKKSLFMILMMIIIIVQIIPCYGSTITKEKLEEAIKNGKGEYTKEINDDEIILSDKYKIIYEINNVPTFKINTNINKEMKWEEYGTEITEWVWFLPVIKAVFECKNVDNEYVEKIGAYFYNEVSKQVNFGDITAKNYMNYNLPQETKKIYGNLNIKNEIFTLKIEEKSVTDTNYNANFIMTVNENVDYKKIIDNYKYEFIQQEEEKVQNEILNKAQNGAETYANEVAKQEETIQKTLNLIDTIEKDKNININEIPQTGKTFETIDLLWIILIISVFILVLYIVYNRRIDGNK